MKIREIGTAFLNINITWRKVVAFPFLLVIGAFAIYLAFLAVILAVMNIGQIISILAILWVLSRVYKFFEPIVYESVMLGSYYLGKLYVFCSAQFRTDRLKRG